ncbi:mechanosensitive ion channel [Candidatus Nasuia deltocephalinicola]|uniref:Mechanosensitive ion channel n=1 Tax=Candidatus Nasuia deltocephalincola TaxID=1160784 RepID=A0A7G6UHR1_9PROT|nr:mechanosensitive ion channel [Candidatus Nasuia deltocephalinicola]
MLVEKLNFLKDLSLGFFTNNILNIKKIHNIFLILTIFLFTLNIFLKKHFYDFYKKIKFYRYIFINILFYMVIFYTIEIKENIFYFLRNIYIKIGNDNLNLLSIFMSIFWILLTFLLSLYNSFLFDFFFKNILFIDLNYKILIFRVFTLIFFLIFLIWGFIYMELDSVILSVLGAAIGIGLSSNIQKLFSNYLSSLIMLFDKNFKMGDAININGYQGVITQINNRYTILRNLDCSEILVPNEKFLNEITQNQSLYFSKGNLRINIQISFNNDFKNVLNILIESLNNIDRVLKNPPPICYITNITYMGVDLELSFWIIDAVRGVSLIKSDVYLNILEIIKNNKIELSYYKKVLKILE